MGPASSSEAEHRLAWDARAHPRRAEHWIRFGIDGWRLDVADEIGEDFWREFRIRVRSISPEAYIVAEIWEPVPEWLTGVHFDATMNYPLLEAVVSFVAGKHLDMDAVAMQASLRDTIAPIDGLAFEARLAELHALYDSAVTAVQMNLLDSHDTPRLRTMCGEDSTRSGSRRSSR